MEGAADEPSFGRTKPQGLALNYQPYNWASTAVPAVSSELSYGAYIAAMQFRLEDYPRYVLVKHGDSPSDWINPQLLEAWDEHHCRAIQMHLATANSWDGYHYKRLLQILFEQYPNELAEVINTPVIFLFAAEEIASVGKPFLQIVLGMLRGFQTTEESCARDLEIEDEWNRARPLHHSRDMRLWEFFLEAHSHAVAATGDSCVTYGPVAEAIEEYFVQHAGNALGQFVGCAIHPSTTRFNQEQVRSASVPPAASVDPSTRNGDSSSDTHRRTVSQPATSGNAQYVGEDVQQEVASGSQQNRVVSAPVAETPHTANASMPAVTEASLQFASATNTGVTAGHIDPSMSMSSYPTTHYVATDPSFQPSNVIGTAILQYPNTSFNDQPAFIQPTPRDHTRGAYPPFSTASAQMAPYAPAGQQYQTFEAQASGPLLPHYQQAIYTPGVAPASYPSQSTNMGPFGYNPALTVANGAVEPFPAFYPDGIDPYASGQSYNASSATHPNWNQSWRGRGRGRRHSQQERILFNAETGSFDRVNVAGQPYQPRPRNSMDRGYSNRDRNANSYSRGNSYNQRPNNNRRSSVRPPQFHQTAAQAGPCRPRSRNTTPPAEAGPSTTTPSMSAPNISSDVPDSPTAHLTTASDVAPTPVTIRSSSTGRQSRQSRRNKAKADNETDPDNDALNEAVDKAVDKAVGRAVDMFTTAVASRLSDEVSEANESDLAPPSSENSQLIEMEAFVMMRTFNRQGSPASTIDRATDETSKRSKTQAQAALPPASPSAEFSSASQLDLLLSSHSEIHPPNITPSNSSDKSLSVARSEATTIVPNEEDIMDGPREKNAGTIVNVQNIITDVDTKTQDHAADSSTIEADERAVESDTTVVEEQATGTETVIEDEQVSPENSTDIPAAADKPAPKLPKTWTMADWKLAPTRIQSEDAEEIVQTQASRDDMELKGIKPEGPTAQCEETFVKTAMEGSLGPRRIISASGEVDEFWDARETVSDRDTEASHGTPRIQTPVPKSDLAAESNAPSSAANKADISKTEGKGAVPVAGARKVTPAISKIAGNPPAVNTKRVITPSTEDEIFITPQQESFASPSSSAHAQATDVATPSPTTAKGKGTAKADESSTQQTPIAKGPPASNPGDGWIHPMARADRQAQQQKAQAKKAAKKAKQAAKRRASGAGNLPTNAASDSNAPVNATADVQKETPIDEPKEEEEMNAVEVKEPTAKKKKSTKKKAKKSIKSDAGGEGNQKPTEVANQVVPESSKAVTPVVAESSKASQTDAAPKPKENIKPALPKILPIGSNAVERMKSATAGANLAENKAASNHTS